MGVSPRRGFTRVAASRAGIGPVVVVVDDSPTGLDALETASREASERANPLHVLDYGQTPVESRVGAADGPGDPRPRLVGLLSRQHVSVVPSPLAHRGVVGYCRQVGASLLVIGADEDVNRALPSISDALGDLPCDILIVMSGQESEIRSRTGPGGDASGG